jgi:hypothetical protein
VPLTAPCNRIEFFSIHYTTNLSKILLFKNKKALQQNAKGLEIDKLPRQDDFRNFCMSEETEKIYQKLEEVISIC